MNKDKAHANDVLNELSTKYGRTVSQIMLRWAKQRGCAVIPGTGNPGEDLQEFWRLWQTFDYRRQFRHL